MKELWNRFEAWLEVKAPEIKELLQEGASDEQITHTESVMNVVFPDDVRACYRIHNGQSSYVEFHSRVYIALFEGKEFLSLERMIDEWTVLKQLTDLGVFASYDLMESQPNGTIKPAYWNIKWIPFTRENNGDLECFDLDPDVDGNDGQIVNFWSGEPERYILAPNFTTWFTDYIEKCETGQIVNYSHPEVLGGLMNKDELENWPS